MGTSKEERMNQISTILPLIKSKKANKNQISDFINIIGKNLTSLMRYFGMKEDEIDEEYSYFIYDFIEALPKLKDDLKFNSFLYGFVRNKCKAYIRNKVKNKMISIDEIENLNFNTNNDFDNFYEKEEIIDLISKALNNVDPKYSECLYMFYYEEMLINDIALELKLTESCVKLRLLRGKIQLEKEIKKLTTKGG